MAERKPEQGKDPEVSRWRRVRGTIGAHLVALVIIQIVLVWGLIAFAGMQDFRKARADAEIQAKAAAGLAADFVEEELASTVTSLQDLPDVLSLITLDKLCNELKKSEALDNIETARWFLVDGYLLNPDGSSACSEDAGQPNVAGESWFKAALGSEELVIEGPLKDPVTGKNVIMYALSVPDSGGLIAYAVELNSVGPALDNQFGYGRAPARFVVVDAERTQEIGSSGQKTGRKLTGSQFARKFNARSNTFEDLEGTERIYATAQVPDVGWRVYAGISTKDAFAPANRALRERIIFAVVILAVVFAAAMVIQRRFVRPIRALAHVTKRFGEGELGASVRPSGPVELEQLGVEFNKMGKVRAEAEAALAKSVKAERRVAEELREVDGMRKAFLMAISHELRTPLTSVVGYSSLLKEAMDEMPAEEVRTCVNAMATQSVRLERLLTDLLDVERLSRGAIQPDLKDTNVCDVVDNVLKAMRLQDRVTTKVSRTARAWVDAALVERIIENLLSNAVKHTPPGTAIWLRASRTNGELLLVVEDAGPGVPDDMKERIFQPFEQGEVPEHAPGTGVGLTLVSQFAKLQGGRAWVEDRRGGGASFRVALPGRSPNADKRRAEAA